MNDFTEVNFMIGLAAKNYDLDGSFLVDRLVIDFIGRNTIQPFASGLGVFGGPSKCTIIANDKLSIFSADGVNSRLYMNFRTNPANVEVGIMNGHGQFTPEYKKISRPDISIPERMFAGEGFSGDEVKVPVYLLKTHDYTMLISNPAKKMFFYIKTQPKIASYTFWNYFFNGTGLSIENTIDEDPASADFSSQVQMYNCNLSLGHADEGYLIQSDFNRNLTQAEIDVIMHGFSGDFSIRQNNKRTSLRAAFFYTDLHQIPSYLSVLKAYAKKSDSRIRVKVKE